MLEKSNLPLSLRLERLTREQRSLAEVRIRDPMNHTEELPSVVEMVHRYSFEESR